MTIVSSKKNFENCLTLVDGSGNLYAPCINLNIIASYTPKGNQTKQNKTNQTWKQTESSPSFIIITTGIFILIIIIVVHHHHRHHHRTGMPKPFCCGNGFCELYSKLILLWKWFPESSISSSTTSFIIITVIIRLMRQ